MSVLVRIAPSPTGLLHVGNIRTALMNWLFARRTGGKFMLRLDDTDRERSQQSYADAIERDLKWMGLTWDLFARQSDRFSRYAEALEDLKKKGRAYPCFETQEELALKRRSQLGRGLPPVYDRAALKLSPDEITTKQKSGLKPHWRFRLSDEKVSWSDHVQGNKEFPAGSLSDPVLVREDGMPLYTFSSVVDDADFAVTHVIRGEDHVANTAVQVEIWKALGAPVPHFAHLPLVILASGEELSKRLGSMSVAGLRDEMGVEALALASLLARSGTSDAIEAAENMQELAERFDFKKIGRAPPKFDEHELLRLNARVLHRMGFAEAKPRLEALGLKNVDEKFWGAVRPNLHRLNEAKDWWHITEEKISPQIEDSAFTAQAAGLLPPEPWDQTTWQAWTEKVKAATARKGKELFMPLRLALTARHDGPEMKTLLPLIGFSRARARLCGDAA
ncbi:MAG: glutamate--tRNA ligase [Proteobacteria bacterium]|nr:glutamate--tRNA ligase [Pseudomonadota bacterium]